MEEIRQRKFTGERAAYGSRNVKFFDCVFEDGESPLKESSSIGLEGVMFRWKYPLWYCRDVRAKGCTWYDMARAGVWYTDNITVEDAVIQAPKNFRRCTDIVLKDVALTDAKETLWNCSKVRLTDVTAKGDYFAMNSSDMEVEGLKLDGNYSFDGVKNAIVRNSRLISKDAFWNSENVTVYDSFISGEYLGWNSKNLSFVNCTIESLQGLCYIDNLTMKNCRLVNTTLAFEYSVLDAEVATSIDSVFNPKEGTIKAPQIKELILEKDKTDAARLSLVCDDIGKRSDKPDWIE